MPHVYLKALSHGSHSFIRKYTTPAFRLSLVSVQQMAPPLTQVKDIQLQLTTHLSTRRDERLSWPGWLTYSVRFTHISGHPSATGQAQDRESSPAKDRRSTYGISYCIRFCIRTCYVSCLHDHLLSPLSYHRNADKTVETINDHVNN